MTEKISGYQCPLCRKRHEDCSLSNCPNHHISEHVCRVFGINPRRTRTKRT